MAPSNDNPNRIRTWLTRALMVPRVAWLGKRTPKSLPDGWNHYWSSVRSTGVGGDVLWDTGDLGEIPVYLPIMQEHMDMTLPIIDIGCGNGRFTRRLAPYFPLTIGIDLSTSAIALARRESADTPEVKFEAFDATVAGATTGLAAKYAPSNVFVRGLFHVLSPSARVELAKNLLPLVGATGRVFFSETNFRGNGMEYLESLGVTPLRVPEPLQRAIRDLPRPGHFGAEETAASFAAVDWELLVDGPSVIETIPLRGPTEPETIPGYFAIMAPRR
jgi:SAM-dependent methyltransferase